MTVTVIDIARAAGVSQPTVSQVLNGKGRISKATRERVVRTAQELGYRPNSYARAMLSRRTGNLGLLLSPNDSRSRLLPGLMDGLQDAVTESRLHLVVGRVSDERLTSSEHVPRLLSEFSADGLLINYFQAIPNALRRLIKECDIPVVWLNSRVESPCIFPDDYGGAIAATERLLHAGHRRITYVEPRRDPPLHEQGHYSLSDRRDGYCEAMRRAGLQPRVVAIQDEYAAHMTKDDARVRDARAALFEGDDRATAVIAYEIHHMVVVAMAATQADLEIGRDVSFATFHAEPPTSLPFRVTVWVVPMREVGRRSVKTLLQLIEGQKLRKNEAEQCIPFDSPIGDVS